MARLTPINCLSNKLYDILVSKCRELAPYPGRFDTNLTRVFISRLDVSSETVTFVIKPSLLFFLDGFCYSELGQLKMSIKPGDFLLLGNHMPTIANVVVPPGRSFLLLMILLDFKLLESLLPFFPKNNVPEKKPSALFSHPVQIDEKLMRILIKLLTSVTLPAPFFSQTPSYLLDLYQYVLNSPLGYILKYAVASKVADISRSIDYLKLRFNQDIAVSELAKVAEMPLTTFHRHFKWQTGMSPLQYLKSVRLIEARRLMLFYGKTAVNSSKDVGYTSSTQFTREYKRIFYKPPRQDMHYTLRYNAPIYQPLSLTHDYDPEIQDE